MRILLIGGEHPTAVGQSLLIALQEHKKHQISYISSDLSPGHSKWLRRLLWHCFDRYPLNFRSLNRAVMMRSAEIRPELLICAGNIPLSSETLIALRDNGVKSGIWLTDDPWSKQHRSRRFLESLNYYDYRFSPRHSAMMDLSAYKAGRNIYLPFGYDNRYFKSPDPQEDAQAGICTETNSVFFAGGADSERAEIMNCVKNNGINLDLYGDYWHRYSSLRDCARGYAPADKLGEYARRAAISLCLVRRANRDGHSMRTYELAASGACMLVEKTDEHVDLFGEDGECVRYFSNGGEMIRAAKELLSDPVQRNRLRSSVKRMILEGGNCYGCRIEGILRHFEGLS